jgi:hypothetical protein
MSSYIKDNLAIEIKKCYRRGYKAYIYYRKGLELKEALKDLFMNVKDAFNYVIKERLL